MVGGQGGPGEERKGALRASPSGQVAQPGAGLVGCARTRREVGEKDLRTEAQDVMSSSPAEGGWIQHGDWGSGVVRDMGACEFMSSRQAQYKR